MPFTQPTYACHGNGKKCFLSISIPISYHSRSATVSTGNKERSFEKLPRCSPRLPTSFFDAAAHFVGLPQEAQPNLTVGRRAVASQLSSPLSAPAQRCPACLCNPTPSQGAIKADTLIHPILEKSFKLFSFEKSLRLWRKHTQCSGMTSVVFGQNSTPP